MFDDIFSAFASIIIVVILAFGIVGYGGYQTTLDINHAKAEVFSKITDNSTNQEIINNINVACNEVSWFTTASWCKENLLDTFIIVSKR